MLGVLVGRLVGLVGALPCGLAGCAAGLAAGAEAGLVGKYNGPFWPQPSKEVANRDRQLASERRKMSDFTITIPDR